MNQFSDSDSTDSEHGIRFKTDSTRNKSKNRINVENNSSEYRRNYKSKDRHSYRYRRSRSPYYRQTEYKSSRSRRRSRSRDRRSKSRSQSPTHNRKKYKQKSRKKYHGRENSLQSDSPSNKNKRQSSDENVLTKSKNVPEADLVKSNPHEKPSFGPTLPPHLVNDIKPTINESKSCTITTQDNLEDNASYGPALPVYILNKHVRKNTDEDTKVSESPVLLENLTEDVSNDSISDGMYGPSLPNVSNIESKTENKSSDELVENSDVKENSRCIGPGLPPHLREKLAENAPQSINDEKDDNDGDDEVYGPLPIDMTNKSEAHIALEERALQMKIDQLKPKEDSKVGREEWMIELPQVHASNLGLGPRQFRPNPAPDLSDRSSWTDTPEDKAKKLSGVPETKVDLKKEAELKEIHKRDKEQDAIIKKHKKKKKERSLLEIHQDKLKEKKKDDQGTSARRPFSREIDLKVNRFDDAQKKSIIKKAQLLDDRFSSGQSKFL